MTTTTGATELEALTQFLYLAPIGLVQATLDGEILMINPMSAQLLMPLSRDGALVNLFDALTDVAPDLRHRARTFPARHGMVCEGVQLRIRQAFPTPGLIPKILSLTLLKLDDTRLMAVIGDVSVSVQRERALRRSQAWIETLIADISDYALVMLDREGRIQCWNASVGRVTGFTEAQSVGRSYDIFYPADALPPARLQDLVFEARRDGWSMDEGWRQRADGSRFWGNCLISPLDVAAGEPLADEPAFSLIIRDISDRKDAHDALRHAVTCDHLTGLANRRAFFEAAEHELQRWTRQPRPMSLVIIDADHFKGVNDLYGHAGGDAVLRHLAAALAACFRTLDVVARIGGEEFAVLLVGTPLDRAAAVAERLCRAVDAQPVAVGEQRIVYTVSAGVAEMDDQVDCIEALMRRADTALYSAKAQGRNRVACWQPVSSVNASSELPTLAKVEHLP